MKKSCKYCEYKVYARGLCRGHHDRYLRGLRGRDLTSPIHRYSTVKPRETTREKEKPQPASEQMMYLRKANSTLEKRIDVLRGALGEQREMAEAIKTAIVAVDPIKQVPWISPKKSSTPVVPVIKFSDWHIGEVIKEEETEGFGSYSWDIAQKRIMKIVAAVIKWVGTLRNGYVIDELVIFGEGDYISGDIHRELSVTNEFPVPMQTAKAGLLFGTAVAVLAPHFNKVTVYQVGADNHGRLERKSQFKQKFQNNMSYLVNMIAETYLSEHKNVTVVSSQGIKYVATVAGWKFLIEHGDTVKSWMGVPYYGIERSRGREAVKRMNTLQTFHYQSIAHWHVPAWVSGNIIINGSLSGTNEFDHGCGRIAPPSQVAFLVHPKYGIFNFIPFRGDVV